MIKNILWDFDGVILDSMKIKGDGFVELFGDYGDKQLNKLEKYHYENGGVSRFEKIRYFYSEILNESISENKIFELADVFANIIERKLYNEENLIKETVVFIDNNYKKYNFHIVSGAENVELNRLCVFFDIDKYFITIEGSPASKSMLIKNILTKFKYKNKETILVGDSLNDFNASSVNHVDFYAYNNSKLKGYNYIYNFQGEGIFEEI